MFGSMFSRMFSNGKTYYIIIWHDLRLKIKVLLFSG